MPARIQLDKQFRESWDARLARWIITRGITLARWMVDNPKRLLALLFGTYLGAYLLGWAWRGMP